MSVPMTKEELIEALNEGRVTCAICGSAKVSPQQARELLLRNLDRIFDPKYKVDLSFEKKYAHLLYGDAPGQQVVARKPHPLRVEKQNQRQ